MMPQQQQICVLIVRKIRNIGLGCRQRQAGIPALRVFGTFCHGPRWMAAPSARAGKNEEVVSVETGLSLTRLQS